MKKIVGYKKEGEKFYPITEEVPDPIPRIISKEDFLQQIKDEINTFFGETNAYVAIGFDETSTRVYEMGAMMVFNILFPTSS
jgi:hypothetical protein